MRAPLAPLAQGVWMHWGDAWGGCTAGAAPSWHSSAGGDLLQHVAVDRLRQRLILAQNWVCSLRGPRLVL